MMETKQKTLISFANLGFGYTVMDGINVGVLNKDRVYTDLMISFELWGRYDLGAFMELCLFITKCLLKTLS